MKVFPSLGTLGHVSPKGEPTMSNHALEKLRAENEQLKTILRHLIPEQSGQYFICGGATELDSDGLPKTILVCPMFGVEGSAIYTQTSPYTAPSW